MDRPMTTQELFNRICDILEEKGKMPDILDYRIATSRPVPIRIYEFELRNNLDYGGSEGIYLDLWIEYCEDNEWLKNDIGTFKTLEDSREAMHARMGGLQGNFIFTGFAAEKNGEIFFLLHGCILLIVCMAKRFNLKTKGRER